MDFAVVVDSDPLVEEKEQAYWVLAVDPVSDRLLLACDSSGLSRLRWVPASECRIGKVASPEQPRPVIAIQPPVSRPVLVDPLALRDGKPRSARY